MDTSVDGSVVVSRTQAAQFSRRDEFAQGRPKRKCLRLTDLACLISCAALVQLDDPCSYLSPDDLVLLLGLARLPLGSIVPDDCNLDEPARPPDRTLAMVLLRRAFLPRPSKDQTAVHVL